ncbi:protein disulfide oxidoreductase [Alicyclobacillus acidocaldarius]|uniref:Glutaredoxin-like domain protein n=1 Tax=Alicyclobacillus acidocaldarius subsp. acidocaldarius (strain ATCC 27009 / DSM 446 / BCRC 14685 / JCM 5260 / KCTC 1825 / NBRC 15652 / NCIMB 11725 / NRRL B-14509 / 104-IA) TaxID=521098 RepID=C8WT27_ALIAD|nr:thioredoxin family protein [Alicyclobacillus acidocaldarius]ACV59542.1 glutaredoxin-like domain protein [Alicyclobacillus acidocaldarius subsp. acidocaldarius DSM 446]
MLSSRDQAAIRERLADLKQPVVIKFFEASLGCPTCPEIRSLLRQVTELSDQLTLEVHNLYIDEEEAKKYGVDRAPTIVLTDGSRKDYGVRFYGTPSGYEFATLLDDIRMMASGDSGLSAGTRSRLAELKEPVDLKVFVTPTCPYCPAAVRLAHRFAFESPLVTASMIEATEFPEWATRFNVYGVPKTVINDSEAYALEGAVPEDVLLEQVLATQA